MAWRSGESFARETYHGEVDHGFGAGLGGFVVADKAAVAHQPAGDAFDDPALGQDVVAIAGGAYHGLALWSDGTVAAWGENQFGQTNIPAGVSLCRSRPVAAWAPTLRAARC